MLPPRGKEGPGPLSFRVHCAWGRSGGQVHTSLSMETDGCGPGFKKLVLNQSIHFIFISQTSNIAEKHGCGPQTSFCKT